MPDWIQKELRELFSTTFAGDWGSSSTPPTARVVRATDTDDDGNIIGSGAPRHVSHAARQKKSLEDGDLVIEASGGSPARPVGRVAYFDRSKMGDSPFLCSNFFKTLRPTPYVHPRFIFWKLHWFYQQTDIYAFQQQTTGIINLKFDQYLSANVSIPSYKDEQRLIAHILDTLDTQIRRTEELIAKLEQIKQGLLTDLLTRGIDENGELRPGPEKAPHLYKDTHLGTIPKEWNIHLVDRIAQRGSGHTPNKNISSYWNGGIDWVSLSDANQLDNVYIQASKKKISELGLANSSAVKHPQGTVILSRDAGIGQSAILGSEMAVSQHFIAWRCGDKLNNEFFYFWLQLMKPRFEAIALGSTIKTIGLPYFRNMEIALPPYGEQSLAAAKLLDLQRTIWSHKESLEKAKLTKGGLMDDLLTGRVRVTRLLAEAERAAG